MDLIVPDAIEPVTGWKALRIDNKGILKSPLQEFRWNPRRRVVAICDSLTYGWQARKGGPYSERHAERSIDPRRLTATTSANPMAPPTSLLLNPEMDTPFGPPPAIVLPDGMHWSWEASPHNPASHPGCGCGIYMVDDPTETLNYLSDECVLVEVAGWGNVIQGTQGARVQYAYPRLIVAPPHMTERAEQAADLYKVPLQIWRPGMKELDLTRTVLPTLNAAKAAAAMNQIAQATTSAHAQIQQLNKTLKTVMPEPERSKASIFGHIGSVALGIAIGAAVVALTAHLRAADVVFLTTFPVGIVCMVADFLVFCAREKAAGR